MRLIDHLVGLGLGRADAKRALSSGKVFVGGVPTALAVREVEGDDVQVRQNAARLRPGTDVVVLDRSPGYVVVWKPPHLLSVPAPGRPGEPNVMQRVGTRFGSAHAVHRLDEDTSGLMLVALDSATQRFFKGALEARGVSRAYLALVRPAVATGWKITVRNTLVRDRGDGRRGVGEGPGGKLAITHFRERQRIGSTASVVEARLETGRTHQIRIHLAELGHPVLGDRLYGPRRSGPLRLALHAHALAFTDPDGRVRTFEVPLPDDITAFIHRDGRAGHGSRETGERRAPPRSKSKRPKRR